MRENNHNANIKWTKKQGSHIKRRNSREKNKMKKSFKKTIKKKVY